MPSFSFFVMLNLFRHLFCIKDTELNSEAILKTKINRSYWKIQGDDPLIIKLHKTTLQKSFNEYSDDASIHRMTKMAWKKDFRNNRGYIN